MAASQLWVLALADSAPGDCGSVCFTGVHETVEQENRIDGLRGVNTDAYLSVSERCECVFVCVCVCL